MTSYDQRGQSVYGDQYNVAGDLVVHGALQITTPAPLSPVEKQTRRDLGLLLNKVRNAWIEGFLERSIHAEALLDVGQTVDPTAVEHPWERVVELPGQAAHPLPPSQPIGTTFAAMERAMLILGEPGSSKTITLLELARELLDQVEASGTFHQPVPVVFNLSSWPGGQPLFDWLVAELSHKYQIPKRIGRAWLEQHRLLPLLDGLDEVRSADRAACVAAINTFGQEYGLAGLAVCSRLDEYTALPIRLKLNGAIRLQPLTAAQVDEYLAHLGPAMDPLRQTLQADQPLRELAQAPLMLNIMSLAYRDEAAQPVQPLATVEARRAHLFNTYIQKMFTRKGKREKPCTDEQMTGLLTWLAQGMGRHDRSIFLQGQLQPSWLTRAGWRWLYVSGSRLLSGAVFGLFLSVVFLQPYWFTLGLIAGLCLGLLDGLRLNSNRPRSGLGQSVWPVAKVMVTTGLVTALSSWLINSLDLAGMIWGITTYGFFEEMQARIQWLLEDLIHNLRFWIQDGLVLGSLLGLVFGLRTRWQTLVDDTHLPETFLWSWPQALRGGLMGLIIWPIVLIAYDFLNWLLDDLSFALIPLTTGQSLTDIHYSLTDRIIEGWSIVSGEPGLWGSYGLRGFIIFGLFFGLVAKVVERPVKVNFRITILASLMFAIVGALVPWIGQTQVVYYVGGRFYSWQMALRGATLAGMFAFVWYGGLDMIQHYTLRLILWGTGQLPWNLTRFLDHATDLIFLRKVGGGYIFIHRLLLEHFAQMPPKPEAQR